MQFEFLPECNKSCQEKPVPGCTSDTLRQGDSPDSSAQTKPDGAGFQDQLNQIRMNPIEMNPGDRITQAAVALVQQALSDRSLKNNTTGTMSISADNPQEVEITTMNGSELVQTDRRGSAEDKTTMMAYLEDRDLITDRDGKQKFSVDELDSGNIFKSKVVTGYFDSCQATLNGADGNLLYGYIKGTSLAPQEQAPDDGRFKESVFHVTDAQGNDLMEEVMIVGKITGPTTANVTASIVRTDRDGNPVIWGDKDKQEPEILGQLRCDLTVDPENPRTAASFVLQRDDAGWL